MKLSRTTGSFALLQLVLCCCSPPAGSTGVGIVARALLCNASFGCCSACAVACCRVERRSLNLPADAKAQTLHAFLGVSQQNTPPPASTPQQAQQAQQQQEQDEATAMDEDRLAQHDGLAPPATAAAAAAAAAAVPAARRRAGPAAVQAGGAGAFEFMPTPMEIAGAGAATAGTAGASQPPAASQQQQQQQRQQGTQFVAPVRQQRATGPGSSLASVRALLAEAESRPHAGGWEGGVVKADLLCRHSRLRFSA